MNLQRSLDNVSIGLFATRTGSASHRGILNQEAFHRMLALESRRTKRSHKSFLLMLLDMGQHPSTKKNESSLTKILSALLLSTRETDVTGWYEENFVVGVMFTEIALNDPSSIPATMLTRVSETLQNYLTAQQFHQMSISFHLLPEAQDYEFSARPSHPNLYPDLSIRERATDSTV